jgi:hypothetical protein
VLPEDYRFHDDSSSVGIIVPAILQYMRAALLAMLKRPAKAAIGAAGAPQR